MTLPIHFCFKRSVELLCFGTSLERIATLIFTVTVDKVKGDTSLYLTQAYEEMKVNMQGLTSVPYPLSVKASISTLRDCATSVGALSHSSPRFEWFANTSQQIHAIPHIRIPILWILQICHGSSYDSVTNVSLQSVWQSRVGLSPRFWPPAYSIFIKRLQPDSP